MKKYEYSYFQIPIEIEEFIEEIEEHNKSGWEFCTVEEFITGNISLKFAILKREIKKRRK